MTKIFILILVVFLYSCTKDEECIDEFALLSEVEIIHNDNDLFLRIVYGVSGCEYIKNITEIQNDSTLEINIIKCVEGKYDPDVMCPSVWIEDSLIKNFKFNIEAFSNYQIIINDSVYKVIRGA